MTITLRLTKGSNLEYSELDNNFIHLRDVASQTSGTISNVTLNNVTLGTAVTVNTPFLLNAAGADFPGTKMFAVSHTGTLDAGINFISSIESIAIANVGSNQRVFNARGQINDGGVNAVLSQATSSDAISNISSPFTIDQVVGVSATTRNIGTGAVALGVGVQSAGIVSGAGNTTEYRGFFARVNSKGSTGTILTSSGLYVDDQGLTGTTSTYGVLVKEQTTAANVYGMRHEVSSGANKWGFYGAGTASNFFAGQVQVAGVVVAGGGGNSVALAADNGNFQMAGGTPGGSANILLFGGTEATAPFEIRFRQGTGIIWKVATATGHFLAGTDNTNDIGATGATRPRTVYAGTSFISQGSGGGNVAGLQVSAVGPAMSLNASTQAGDNRLWDTIVQNLQYNFRTVNDANSLANVWLSVVRSGLAITQISFSGGSPTNAEQVRITPVSAATAFVNLSGGVGTAVVSGAGAAADVGLSLASKGTGTLTLTIGTGDIQWGKALVALGGGAAPTFGTIGGTGPATAAQNTWLRALDSTGATIWIPVWK